MARLFIEGFEHGSANTSLFNSSSFATYSAQAGMTGSYCGRLAYVTAYGEFTLASSKTELYMASKIWHEPTSLSGGGLFAWYDSGGTVIASMIGVLDGTHIHFRFLRGNQSGGTTITTGTKIIEPSQTYLLEMYYKPLNTDGLFTLKVDGVVDIEVVAGDHIDTTAGLENIAKVRWGYSNLSHQSVTYWDDLVLDDADWIGNTSIQKLQISGAGSSTNWTPSTGSNYACVDELPYSDVDYIYTNDSGESDTFACSDLTGNISLIKSLAVQARMAYEGTPTPTQQKIAIRVNGSEYYGSDVLPSLTFSNYSTLWEVNPDDSNPWEESDINAIEIGVRSVA